MVLAGALPPFISENAVLLQSLLTLFGLLLILGFPLYRSAILRPTLSAENVQFEVQKELSVYNALPLPKYLLRLFVLQGSLFYISLFFFYHLESMTRLNGRLQPLREGQIFEIMSSNFFQHSYIPWVLYSLVAMGLAYFSFCVGRYPSLPKMILPLPRGTFQWYLHNSLHIIVDAVMLGPFIWLLPLAMVLCSEGLNQIFELASLFQSPERSMFILGFICLFCNRSHRRLLEVMDRLKAPLGTIFIVYILFGGLLIFLLHAVSGWLLLAFETSNLPVQATTTKSLMAHALTDEQQSTRLSILIWSWWAIWLPWMAAQIANLSVGRKLWVACLSSLLLPSLFLLWWQNGAAISHYSTIHSFLQQSLGKLTIAFAIILFLFYYFRHIYTLPDFVRGGMLTSRSQKRDQSLGKWLNVLYVLMSGYTVALFMIGWLSVQILASLGGLVMVVVLLGFILALLSSKDFLSALKKYKVQVKPEY
jgi:choline-glycine betaine transporter